MEWSEFLTPEEKRQLETLMEKAAERENKQVSASGGNRFLLMKCQVDCLRQMEGAEQMDVSGDIDSMQKILKAICKFCREHGCNEYRMNSGQSVKPAAI